MMLHTVLLSVILSVIYFYDIEFCYIFVLLQFTLYHTLKGNKPDFHLAMNGEAAKSFYEEFLSEMKKQYAEDKIKDGIFAALMQVSRFFS